MAGRIEAYIHSDTVTPNKGGCLIEVTCQTSFAACTEEFIDFCKKAAKLVYAYDNWENVIVNNPEAEEERKKLEEKLKEEIEITESLIMQLTPEWLLERDKTARWREGKIR